MSPAYWLTALLASAIAFCGTPAIAQDEFDYGGHLKYQASIASLPQHSLLRDFLDDPSVDNSLDLRLKLSARRYAWSWQADYQLQASKGDSLSLLQQNPALLYSGAGFPDDAHRIFDLSHLLSEDDDRIIGHRLDRLNLRHTSSKTVLSIGRQSLSWGNGIFYNPMDFFNPFDPATIDSEYKTGDDMIYGQYLLDSGDDLQAVWVGRRDDAHDISSRVSSIALKYHGFGNSREFDLLIAEHYDQRIIAVGGTSDWADALWRSDVVLSASGDKNFTSAVLNWSYSWIAWERNISSSIEYFHNGFGIADGDYSPANMVNHPELLTRLQRAELFSLGENYLSAAATIELTPLWLFTLSLFNNLDDASSLLQFFSRHDLQQNLHLLVALNLPMGERGTEFGGIASGVGAKTLASGEVLIAQLAWYF